MAETTEAPMHATPAPRASRRRHKGLIEWVAIIVAALAAAFLIKTFVIQAFYIPSGSMTPTIEPGDRVLVDKLDYSVQTGSIIVFRKPPADPEGGIDVLIKRVVGLPGQALRSGPHGEIFVDGRLLHQPWLSALDKRSWGPGICTPDLGPASTADCHGRTLVLGKGQYFVMGDHRDDSEDSRYWGPLQRSLIIGRAFVRIWPLSRLHWF